MIVVDPETIFKITLLHLYVKGMAFTQKFELQ